MAQMIPSTLADDHGSFGERQVFEALRDKLDDDFVEGFLAFAGSNLFIIITNTAARLFLFCIVRFISFVKKLMICFAYILSDIGHILLCS